MKSIDNPSLKLAIWLSALAGYIDALGFLYLGGYFISFMSGNSTRFAVVLEKGDGHAAFILAAIISLFVFGAMLGGLISHYGQYKSRGYILVTVTFMLVTAAVLNECGFPDCTIGIMVISMGIENAAFQKDETVNFGLTYMTGNLVKLGQKLAAAIVGNETREWMSYLFLWLALMAGGFTGAVAYAYFGLRALWLAIILCFGLTAVVLKQKAETI